MVVSFFITLYLWISQETQKKNHKEIVVFALGLSSLTVRICHRWLAGVCQIQCIRGKSTWKSVALCSITDQIHIPTGAGGSTVIFMDGVMRNNTNEAATCDAGWESNNTSKMTFVHTKMEMGVYLVVAKATLF
jgi:hypothetical protein